MNLEEHHAQLERISEEVRMVLAEVGKEVKEELRILLEEIRLVREQAKKL